MVVVAFILILMFGASAMQDNIMEHEESSKAPVSDPEILNQLFQNNDIQGSSQEIRSNATEKERKLTPTCTNGQNNCQTCASSTLCGTCTSYTDIPDIDGGCTASSMKNCAVVSSSFECSICNVGYTQGCTSCNDLILGCTGCTNSGKCNTCASGYYLNMDRTCSTCEVSGCDTCTSGQTCSKCATGYYLDSNSCKACSGFNKNCQECSGAGFCTNCKTGYVASDSGTCFASSIPNCKVLNADGVSCKTCLSGYYENNGSCAQIACTGIQYWDGVNKQCTMCSTIDPDCTICTSDKKCTSCSVGKIANDAGLCSTSTLTHCSLGNSTDPKYCTKCSTGYISDGIGGCIQSQLQRCKEASSATVCKICSSGTASGCGPCSPTSAVPDCACASQGGSVCTRCNDGYTLKAGSCSLTIACSSNCADCSSIDICTQCNSGYFLYDESATKTSCVCKIYLACADSCNLCTNSPVCFECADLVVQDGSSCRVDKVGYQLSFDSPDAVIDFAHPLSKTVGFNSFTASKGQASVPTGGWSIKSSTVSQIKVQTDLDETKLPIDITFSFKQNES